jgi:hypothetical protein
MTMGAATGAVVIGAPVVADGAAVATMGAVVVGATVMADGTAVTTMGAPVVGATDGTADPVVVGTRLATFEGAAL